MRIFKSLLGMLYEGNDRIPLKMCQADYVNDVSINQQDCNSGKLRLCATNGHGLVSYIFKKIKSNKFYYLTRNNVKKLAKEDKFCFKNGYINDIKLLEDGEQVKICDTKTSIGSWYNKESSEHYPIIDAVIPVKFKYRFNINRKLLRKALKNETHVTLKITENSLLVYSTKVSVRTCKQTRKSKPKVSIPIEFIESTFDDVETVLFDVLTLEPCLCLPYDDITLGFNSRVSALVVMYEDKQIKVTNLAMPKHITSDSI